MFLGNNGVATFRSQRFRRISGENGPFCLKHQNPGAPQTSGHEKKLGHKEKFWSVFPGFQFVPGFFVKENPYGSRWSSGVARRLHFPL